MGHLEKRLQSKEGKREGHTSTKETDIGISERLKSTIWKKRVVWHDPDNTIKDTPGGGRLRCWEWPRKVVPWNKWRPKLLTGAGESERQKNRKVIQRRGTWS